jgi:heme/copper-type cytochrome/quinol oxidase subunit 2
MSLESPARGHVANVRDLLRSGVGAALLLTIMFTGSVVLWAGTPLAWLWIASQVQGAIESLGISIMIAFAGVIVTVLALATVLSRLSDVYRANRRARGMEDPGHVVLENVLIVSAGISLAVFGVWFLFFAGADPAPIGINL